MVIRRVRAGEAERLRELRLRALSDAPYAFSSTYESEVADALERWASLARDSEAGEERVVFVVEAGDAWLGMAGAYLDDGEAGLWGMWVADDVRGRGAAGALLEAAADWARDRGASVLRLSVTSRAEAAARIYARAGFEPTGEVGPLDSDPGAQEIGLARPL